VICRACDRGDLYCGRVCSRRQRIVSQRAARRRYRQSPRGKRMNAEAQARFRRRRRAEQQKVMDQGLDAVTGLGRVERDGAEAIDMESIPAASGDPDHDSEEAHEDHPPGEQPESPTLGIRTLLDGAREVRPHARGGQETCDAPAATVPGGARGASPPPNRCARCGRENDGWFNHRERRWNGKQRAPWHGRRGIDSS
jgi:hypothetical protein